MNVLYITFKQTWFFAIASTDHFVVFSYFLDRPLHVQAHYARLVRDYLNLRVICDLLLRDFCWRMPQTY